MIKIGVARKSRIPITFTSRDIHILDTALAIDAIQDIGIDSRATLLVCITYAIAKKFKALGDELRASYNVKAYPQPVIHSRSEVKKLQKEMLESKAGYELGLSATQPMLLMAVRNLLAAYNPRYKHVKSILDISIDELREQYQAVFLDSNS